MDREKVINELNECIEHIRKNKFNKIPCWGNCQSAMIDAVSILKEQEAVEPYITGRGESFESAETWRYACGNCHEALDINDKYCRHCGRPVNWNK